MERNIWRPVVQERPAGVDRQTCGNPVAVWSILFYLYSCMNVKYEGSFSQVKLRITVCGNLCESLKGYCRMRSGRSKMFSPSIL